MHNKPSTSNTIKMLLFCVVSITTLFLGFYSNFFRAVDQQWFDNHQRDMESFVIGRIVKSGQDGIFSSGGLLGRGDLDASTEINQYFAYKNNIPFGVYETYNSQIGGQGIIFSILDESISLSPQEKLNLFHAITALLSAIALSTIMLWFYFEFGLAVGLFVLVTTIFSQWLVVFGRNLWWSMWAFFLPVAAIMHYLKFKWEKMSNRLYMFGVIVFITVLIKCLINGYEYMTTTLIMMVVPLVYYGNLREMSLRKFFSSLSVAGLCSVLAVLLSFVILGFQLATVKGSFLNGMDHIIYAFKYRTYANPEYFPEVAPSLEASLAEVLYMYLKGTFFDANYLLQNSNPFISKFLLKFRYLPLILLFLIMTGILNSFRKKSVDGEEQTYRSLIIATWFSILAPLSWFIIFKSHSYIHGHINYIVWQMPYTIFGFAICGMVIKKLWSGS